MKKIIIGVFVLLAYACDQDNPKDVGEDLNSILGAWKYIRVVDLHGDTLRTRTFGEAYTDSLGQHCVSRGEIELNVYNESQKFLYTLQNYPLCGNQFVGFGDFEYFPTPRRAILNSGKIQLEATIKALKDDSVKFEIKGGSFVIGAHFDRDTDVYAKKNSQK